MSYIGHFTYVWFEHIVIEVSGFFQRRNTKLIHANLVGLEFSVPPGLSFSVSLPLYVFSPTRDSLILFHRLFTWWPQIYKLLKWLHYRLHLFRKDSYYLKWLKFSMCICVWGYVMYLCVRVHVYMLVVRAVPAIRGNLALE